MKRVLIFDLTGPMAHFRKYYTNSSSLTYGFPPRTVLMGVVAAVVGYERDSYYELLDRGRFAVAVKVPGRRLVQTVNYVRTKREDLTELRRLGRARGTQTPVEFLLPEGDHRRLRFRIFFSHPDAGLVEEAAARLRENRTYYPLYLGLTECIAAGEYVALAGPDDYDVLPAGTALTLTSVLNAALLQEILLAGETPSRRLVRERAPHSFGPGRILRPPVSVIYEARAQSLNVRLAVPACRFLVGDNAVETVAFLEG
ncbi:CRISPR-associated protein Cas5 [Desulfofundulus sp. TPOSR]|uniref:CRISPR-associated protein Cas5 n=1 Tax=Desulfofundulus sp. TPOSR TaxID=2714340 RepID=UPI00140806BA|nr:CRISPR-associated protein Cas5 [Desulfofundulus sp. TPOSR]NHM26261.1 CRISPR-associated protein Cas5 [Desulfofundulus sp. TPOSR]